jgi:hypothetical protein
MEDILWIEDIVENAPNTPFLNTYTVGTIGLIDPHKVVVWRNTFLALENAQNESVSKMRIKSFGHGRLKCPFSQVERYLHL